MAEEQSEEASRVDVRTQTVQVSVCRIREALGRERRKRENEIKANLRVVLASVEWQVSMERLSTNAAEFRQQTETGASHRCNKIPEVTVAKDNGHAANQESRSLHGNQLEGSLGAKWTR
jgi:hypothetical protein